MVQHPNFEHVALQLDTLFFASTSKFFMSEDSVSEYTCLKVVQSRRPRMYPNFENVTLQRDTRFVASTSTFL